MRYVLILWAVPLTLFWSWYGLSANDINFGTMFFSRQVHDAVFQVYANSIGTDPAAIPGMIAGASIFDSALIGALAAFRWRKSWWPQTRASLEHRFARLQQRFGNTWNARPENLAILAPVTAEPSGPERPEE